MFLAKLKTTAAVLGACLLAAAAGVFTYGPLAADGPQDKAAGERKKLEGTWAAVAVVHGGREVPAEHIRDARMVFSGDTFVIRHGEQVVMKGTYKLDPSKTPPAIDLTFTEG